MSEGAEHTLDIQQTHGILRIDLLEDRFGKTEAVNPPSSLRRHGRRCVVEVLVFGFEKPVVDLVKLIVEDLLRRLFSAWNRVGAEHDAVLKALDELVGSSRLSAQFSDAGRNLDVHVGMAVEALRYVLEIFRIRYVQADELCPRVPAHHV